MEFLVTTDRGLEDILLMESEGLGLRASRTKGGIVFHGEWEDCLKANLSLRTAVRVLFKVGKFFATTKREFYNKIKGLWNDALPVPGSFSGTSEVCKLYHTGLLKEQSEKALGKDPNGPKLVVKGFKNVFEIYLDTSGEPLYKRGFGKLRVQGALSENFAAGLLLKAGYDGSEPLLDPFCGGGTILMEAALIATNTPPGIRRSFEFEKWPEPIRLGISEKRPNFETKTLRYPIIGLDRDEEAVATASVAQAELGIYGIEVFSGDACSIRIPKLPKKGLVATNMPYNKLTRGEKGIYSCFGQRLQDRLKGWRVGIILPDDKGRIKLLRQKFKEKIKVNNRGIPVVFAIGDGTAGAK